MKTANEILIHYCSGFDPLFMDDEREPFRQRIIEAMEEYASIEFRNKTLDLLDRYTEFLQKEGYLDTDATLEHPTAIDRFLKLEKLKKMKSI